MEVHRLSVSDPGSSRRHDVTVVNHAVRGCSRQRNRIPKDLKFVPNGVEWNRGRGEAFAHMFQPGHIVFGSGYHERFPRVCLRSLLGGGTPLLSLTESMHSLGVASPSVV